MVELLELEEEDSVVTNMLMDVEFLLYLQKDEEEIFLQRKVIFIEDIIQGDINGNYVVWC